MAARVFLVVLPLASAFSVPASAPGRAGQLNAVEKSAAIPFLSRPAKLDGTMIGDVGFDPFLISDTLPDLAWARAAEIKHGRVAMLATLGFVAEEIFQFPTLDTSPDPLAAIVKLPFAANCQVFAVCAAIEFTLLEKQYANEGEPGDFGWDPAMVLLEKSPEYVADMKLKEITHGRLAMMGFFGMLVQNLLFQKPLLSF